MIEINLFQSKSKRREDQIKFLKEKFNLSDEDIIQKEKESGKIRYDWNEDGLRYLAGCWSTPM